jgi:hypothetical protein
MPALGAGIQVVCYSKKDVDARHKAGHDAKNYYSGEKSAGRKMSACCAMS